MSIESIVYFVLLALLAEILGTVGGFGSSLFFVPIASYFMDFQSVLGITALFHVSSNLVKIVMFRKGFDKQLILSIGVPAVIFVVIGAFLSKYVASVVLEILLSIFLIVVSLTFMIFKTLVVKPTLLNSISGGVFSGFIAGLIGTGGAIRGITLAAFNLRADVFIATSAIIDLGIDSSRSVVYYLNGYIPSTIVYLIPALLVASVSGTYVGKRILDRVSQEHFKMIVLVLILLTGIITLVKFGLAKF